MSGSSGSDDSDMVRHGQYARKRSYHPVSLPSPPQLGFPPPPFLHPCAAAWAASYSPRDALARAARFSWTFLLHAALELGAPEPVLDALLAPDGATATFGPLPPPLARLRPAAEGARYGDGDVPLCTAIDARAPVATVLRLLSADPAAARCGRCALQRPPTGAARDPLARFRDFEGAPLEGGGCGHRLALHAAAAADAAPEVVAALLSAHPEAARARFASAGAPLHVAAAARAGAGVVRLLLAAAPHVAAERSQLHGASDLPLLLALRSGAPAASVALLLEAHPPAARGVSDVDGASPLLAALCAPRAHAVGADTLAALLAAEPGAAATVHEPRWGRRTPLAGARPLHAAARSQARGAPLSLLLAAHPGAAAEASAAGWLPLHFACAGLGGAPADTEDGVALLLAAFPGAAGVPFGEPPARGAGGGRGGGDGGVDGDFTAFEVEVAGALPLHAAVAAGAPAGVVAALVDAFPGALRTWFGAPAGEDPRVSPAAAPRALGLGSLSGYFPSWLAEGLEAGAGGGRGGRRTPNRELVARAVKRKEASKTAAEMYGEGLGSRAWTSEEEDAAWSARASVFADRVQRAAAEEAARAAAEHQQSLRDAARRSALAAEMEAWRRRREREEGLPPAAGAAHAQPAAAAAKKGGGEAAAFPPEEREPGPAGERQRGLEEEAELSRRGLGWWEPWRLAPAQQELRALHCLDDFFEWRAGAWRQECEGAEQRFWDGVNDGRITPPPRTPPSGEEGGGGGSDAGSDAGSDDSICCPACKYAFVRGAVCGVCNGPRGAVRGVWDGFCYSRSRGARGGAYRPSKVVHAALAAGLSDTGEKRKPCSVCGCGSEFSADGERACFCDACRGGCRLHASYDAYVGKAMASKAYGAGAPSAAKAAAAATARERDAARVRAAELAAVREFEGHSGEEECLYEGDRAYFKALTEGRVDRAFARVRVALATERAAPRRSRFFGCLPLHVACMVRAPRCVVAALLAAGGAPAAAERNVHGLLPLHVACLLPGGPAADVLDALLAAEPHAAREPAPCARVDERLRAPGGAAGAAVEGWLPVELACMQGASVEAVAALVAAHPAALHAGTALRAACLYKAPAALVCALLAAHPAAATLPAANGMLPVHFAAMNLGDEHDSLYVRNRPTPPLGNTEVLALLLAAAPLAPTPAPAPRGVWPVVARSTRPPTPFAVAAGTRAGGGAVAALLAADPGAARGGREADDAPFFDHLFPERLGDTRREERTTWLHAVCADPFAPGEVVEAVLRAHPEAARVCLRGGAASDLAPPPPPPWASARSPPPAPLPAATQGAVLASGELPLHLACLRGAPGGAIPALVASFPEGVRVPWRGTRARGRRGEMGRGGGAAAAQQGAGLLPLELALASCEANFHPFSDFQYVQLGAPPPAAIGALLAALTVTGDGGSGDGGGGGSDSPTPPPTTPTSASSAVTPTSAATRGGGGGAAALDTNPLVDFLLTRGEGMVAAFSACCDALAAAGALHAAAGTPNSSGRTPYAVAGPLCRAEFRRRLFLLGRFQLEECVHESATSRVLHARDFEGDSAKGRPVALKFMRHGMHWAAELRARAAAAGAPHCFLPVLASFSAEGDAPFAAELSAKALASFPFLLVMAAGDRSLEDCVAHESASCGWAAEVARACAQLASALAALHAAGVMHGDVKPRNVVRVGARYRLIDFDSAASLGEARGAGAKLSTAYAPPEALSVTPDGRVVAAPDALASAAVDAWGLGATLYRLLVCATLVHATDADDAVGDAELRAVAAWDDRARAAALARVGDARARNLLAQLLHPRPEARPALARVLVHPFFTGREAARLVGEPAQWDVFLSYRVASDQRLAGELHAALEARGLRVFWDKVCLVDGKPWREGFFQGLVRARAFLPILSRGALKPVDGAGAPAWGNWEALTPASACDNVLLEHRAALECFDRGLLEFVLPVFVGDEGSGAGGLRGTYFGGCCAPTPAPVVVAALEAELAVQLDRAGLGTPYAAGMTAAATFERVKAFQGKMLEGDARIGDLVGGALEAVLRASAQPPAAPEAWEAHADGSGRVWYSGPNGEVAWVLPEGALLAPPRVPPPS